ncbi:DUF4062 domain-containing protein [Pseudomonas syringae]|uniref:DUF4062 domain-containing protein n=1 Tax=Pseudomonas syringae TaxID=317 RepID=UPI001F1983A1|nr:DUF4062 domain-containing protein [Pseudomonas syringae]MCF5733991.1 hypothetical protein [Pseudomonas syringae]MCF5737750.1 hypothetical protein [Pseudomonas syringae]MCF5749151.1 hypothetical protein [Pseudomonas syringae]MCF5754061.1 hypothetical protein [Pseudomonas syringae]
MAYSATVFNVLIASPSDVNEEREAIAQTIHDWNSLNSGETGKVLLPVRWESHSAPAMGDRPQGIINNQVVRDCDMLIGAFWTRLGSPTGIEDSGTVEEIKFLLKQEKPVMLYYSKKPVDMDEADLEQVQKLKDFKKSIRDKGIQEQYNNIDELKQKLMRQLTIVMRGISVGTHVNAKVVKEAKEDRPSEPKILTKPTKTKKPKQIELLDYTDKSFVVVGDTTDFKEKFSSINGKWMKMKSGSFGWMFSKKRLDEVAEIIGITPVLTESQ